jgi:hypothetical protein
MNNELDSTEDKVITQMLLVRNNIGALKFRTNIDESNHKTITESYDILTDMVFKYIKKLKQNKTKMNKNQIIGKKFNLDLGDLSPVGMIVRDVTKDKVIVEYLRSTPGRIEEFTISEFEYFTMIKIEI